MQHGTLTHIVHHTRSLIAYSVVLAHTVVFDNNSHVAGRAYAVWHENNILQANCPKIADLAFLRSFDTRSHAHC